MRADAVWESDSYSVGDGGERADSRGGRAEVETLWSDDGFVLRFPDTDEPPDVDWFMVEPGEATALVLRQLGTTALFAGDFASGGTSAVAAETEADARSPLWQLRKRSYDLLSVASRYPKFPLLLEAYRECLPMCLTCRRWWRRCGRWNRGSCACTW